MKLKPARVMVSRPTDGLPAFRDQKRNKDAAVRYGSKIEIGWGRMSSV